MSTPTTTPLTITPMTTADAGEVLDLYEHYALHSTCTALTDRFTPAQRSDWIAVHHPERYPVMIAREQPGGPIVGWAGISPWSPRQAYARTAEESVYVAPTHLRRGVGGAVLRALIPHVRAHTGVRLLIARIMRPNPSSEALHAGLGFRSVGIMTGCAEKFGRVLDVHIMEKAL